VLTVRAGAGGGCETGMCDVVIGGAGTEEISDASWRTRRARRRSTVE
jgi:hypothetical protein